MPLYEYFCDRCDDLFESLRPLRESDLPVPCPRCGREADRIMPTSFSSMSWNRGYPQRVPFHQRPIRNRGEQKSAIARVKPKNDRKSAQKKR